MSLTGSDKLIMLKQPDISVGNKGISAILLGAYLRLNRENWFSKRDVANASNINMCNRTFNKYWRDMIAAELIRYTGVGTMWMINPIYAYSENTSVANLKQLWETLDADRSSYLC